MVFSYTIKDPVGIHARPAGVLAAVAAKAGVPVKITKGDTTVEADKLFAIMSLAAKCGDTITVECEDDAVAEAFKKALEENL